MGLNINFWKLDIYISSVGVKFTLSQSFMAVILIKYRHLAI